MFFQAPAKVRYIGLEYDRSKLFLERIVPKLLPVVGFLHAASNLRLSGPTSTEKEYRTQFLLPHAMNTYNACRQEGCFRLQ